jgi:hypothetical protein
MLQFLIHAPRNNNVAGVRANNVAGVRANNVILSVYTENETGKIA